VWVTVGPAPYAEPARRYREQVRRARQKSWRHAVAVENSCPVPVGQLFSVLRLARTLAIARCTRSLPV